MHANKKTFLNSAKSDFLYRSDNKNFYLFPTFTDSHYSSLHPDLVYPPAFPACSRFRFYRPISSSLTGTRNYPRHALDAL